MTMNTQRDYLDDEPGEYRRQCEMMAEEKRNARRAKELADQWEAFERAKQREKLAAFA
jgi:hypothetical protein